MLLKGCHRSMQIHQMQCCMQPEHGGYLVLMHAVIQVILGAIKLQVQGFPLRCSFDLQSSTCNFRPANPQQMPTQSSHPEASSCTNAHCQRKHMLYQSVGQQMSALPCDDKACPAKQAAKTTTASENHLSSDCACPAVQGACPKPTAARSSPLP